MLHTEYNSDVNHKVRNFCEDLYDQGNRSPYLLAYLIDLCEDAIQHKASDASLNCQRALEVCRK